MTCRHCGADVRLSFLDLGSAPFSNAYLTKTGLQAPETWYPLRVSVCESCWLVQTENSTSADSIFTADYAYFSSVSSSWLQHAQRYVDTMSARLGLDSNSLVTEIAANDGYLLQYVRRHGIPCYGIEPTRCTADAARQKGIDIVEAFFGNELATSLSREGRQADLVIANNVLAHVPDINDFVAGVSTLLKDNGTATFEFPYLVNLVQQNQFDTIYHEHYSYLSLTAVDKIFRSRGLQITDVEKIPTHGGSLRVFARRIAARAPISTAVNAMLEDEQEAGISTAYFYSGFQSRVNLAKHALLSFLIEQKAQGRKVGAYGAAAKGNTLLNFSGIREDLLPYVVDRSPAKQGKYLPGSRIPIVDEAHMHNERPDWIVILPWNLKQELEGQLHYARSWGAQFVLPIPTLTTF